MLRDFKSKIKTIKILYFNKKYKETILIQGKGDVIINKNKSRIICIGNCSKEFAIENNFKFLDGCPCDYSIIVKEFFNKETRKA